MSIIIQMIYWLILFLIIYHYILYPLLMKFLALFVSGKIDSYSINEIRANIAILMAVHNEESVIIEKLESIIRSDFPFEKLEILIGSDNSDDKTCEIISDYIKKYPNIKLIEFNTRQGKQSIINQLSDLTQSEILILTDANVMFDKETIYELVKYFKSSDIGLVDSKMQNYGLRSSGISVQESYYNSSEARLKDCESKVFGAMIGPFGGCYAIRKKVFEKVPANFLVDDFYINMMVLKKGYKSINNLSALVFEDVSNNIKDDYKRKKRIGAGNFQNLAKFKSLFLVLFGINTTKSKSKIFAFGVAFCFFSHKVIRWITPFLLIFILLLSFFLLNILVYKVLLVAITLSFLIVALDIVLRFLKINIGIFRFLTHFYSSNFALLAGFCIFALGVKSGVWSPTRRNQ